MGNPGWGPGGIEEEAEGARSKRRHPCSLLPGCCDVSVLIASSVLLHGGLDKAPETMKHSEPFNSKVRCLVTASREQQTSGL